MAPESAHPEVIKPSLPSDAPIVNGDHDLDHDMANGQHNSHQNADAFVENGAISKQEIDVNNTAADSNPPGPTPVEDVAPGIVPVSDFIPKDAPTSHPTPPPDEPLATSEANVDTEMQSVDEPARVETEQDPVAAVAPAVTTESSLVRPREDDDADDEPAAKRNKVEDVPMPEAKPATIPSTEVPDTTQPGPEQATEPEAARPESSGPVAQPAPSTDNAMDTPPTTSAPSGPTADAPPPDAPVPATEGNEVAGAKPVLSNAKPVDASELVKAAEVAPHKHQYSKEPMTQSQMKFLLEKMKNLKKTKNSVAFLHPVDHVALNIPTYPDIIKEPMDLNTMESKLKSNQYNNVQQFADDFDLIISNTRKFNGDTHLITQAGFSMEAYFRKMMETVPSATQASLPKPQVKKASPKPPAPAARRESRSANQAPGVAPQATGAGGADSFALQPNGTPQIRRDSTINRPARTIKPPPARELAYAKPKRKEHQLELKFCEHILDELRSPKFGQVNHVFLTPVDPVALNIPHYRQIVKNPMDLSTMAQKLKQGQYGKANEFKKDFELMIQNCLAFNPAGNVVRDLGIQFKRNFDTLWQDKDKWEKKRKADTQRATSASGDDDSADEEEEEEEEEAPDDPAGTIRALQKQLADMQNALAGLNQQKRPKKPKAPKPATKKTERVHVPQKSKVAPVKAKAPKKVRQVTYEEKQEISEAVNKMDEAQVQELTRIITENCQKYRDQEEMELEIDDLPNDVQSMLLKYVRSLFGNPNKGRAVSPDDAAAMDDDDFEPERGARRGGGGGGGAASKKKKHKPMGKDQQTAAIESIQKKLAQFQQAGVSASQSPTGSNNYAMADDTSGDDESEESEEE
ncbi:hypothetical protein DOTSEDRAFT_68295 [Dothistroma septosporum NZE10]|uniref:Bromodomain-containing protein n=1 Tax=Dothistroma septosporum (strain NZE10 / CBS 128990) TaxID=675120 RepID=N1Q1C1_DOTSN|nr:hypothetical protein DOTSEDRAFT_68295 [Dothistroma septosporum NZE10]